MTFEEAKQELDYLADGEFRSISYELTTYHDKTIEVKCEIYLADHGYFSSNDWKSTLNKLKIALGKYQPNKDEQPQGEKINETRRV